MQTLKVLSRLFFLASLLTLTIPGPGGAAHKSLPEAMTIYRTVVAHQITQLTHLKITDDYDYAPMISGSGNRVAFASYDRTYGHMYLYTANFDGSGMQVIEDKVVGAATYYYLNISDDGAHVAYMDHNNVHAYTLGGSVATYCPITGICDGPGSAPVTNLALTGDGSRFYFNNPWDQKQGGDIIAPMGVYRMNWDGSGVERIISGEMLAAAAGVEAAAITYVGCGQPVSVSSDGERLMVCANQTGSSNQFLFAANGDGSGLHVVRPNEQAAQLFTNFDISRDGSTLYAYGTYQNGATQIMTWEGDLIRSVPMDEGYYPACIGYSAISGSGDKFLRYCVGMPYIDAATGNRELYFGRGSFPGYVYWLMNGSMTNASLSKDGKRAVYSTDVGNGYNQVATAEVNPASLGGAPAISNPDISPATLLPNAGSSATLTFHADLPANKRCNIGTGVTYLGSNIYTITTPYASGAPCIQSVDYANTISAGAVQAGYYTYRIVADIEAEDGKLHATGVYFGPLVVGPVPGASASINFTTGKPGSYFTVTGQNFPPGQPVTAAANGTVLATNLMADGVGGLVFYLDTHQADPGAYILVLYNNTTLAKPAAPVSAAAVRFSLADSDPLRPLAGTEPIFEIPAGLKLREVLLPVVRK